MIVVNVIIFFIVDLSGGSENAVHMLNSGAANAALIVEGKEYYRLFTSMFLHFGMAHLANNMLVLFVIGDNLERAVGKARYLLIYFLSGIGGNLLSCYLDYLHECLGGSVWSHLWRDGSHVVCTLGEPRAAGGPDGEADRDYGWLFPLLWIYQFWCGQCGSHRWAGQWFCSGFAVLSPEKDSDGYSMGSLIVNIVP